MHWVITGKRVADLPLRRRIWRREEEIDKRERERERERRVKEMKRESKREIRVGDHRH